ncbi:MAG: cell wall hydrolase [Bacillota bacterium]
MKQIVIVLLTMIFLVSVINISFAAPTFQVDLIYEVQSGDTLFDLARKFNLNVNQLKEKNDLAQDESIRVEDKLVIPDVDSSELDLEVGTSERISLYKSQDESEQYQLDSNQQYNVRIDSQNSGQNIDIDNLQTLEYYVSAGDNLYDLAREFKTSIQVLKKINDLGHSNVIRKGDKIKLPINNLTEKEVIYHTISDQEFELLARLIHGEARGESYIGQVAVGAVILNRMLSSYFPNDIRSVIYQSGQFSPVANGQINLRPNRTAYRAARSALQGQDPTRGARYFYNPQTAKDMWWFKTREVVVEIGNHVFAK